MKKLSVIVLAVLMAIGFGTTANAALTFDVDFWTDGSNLVNYSKGGPSDLDLGGTFDLEIGEFINVDIYFSTDQELIGGSWDLKYSPAVLVSVEGTTPAGGNWLLPIWSTSPGSVKYQDGWFPPGTFVPGDDIFFGSVLFQCQGPGDVDLVLAVDPAIGGFLTATDVIPFADVNLGTLHQPVPIPGAIWLLGTGLFGLLGIRRVRRN